MATLDQLIALLALNDGRDKIYKFLGGVLKILAACCKAKEQKALASAFASLGNAIASARSVMRMGKFIADVPKYDKLTGKLQKKGLDLLVVIELLRTLGNSFYIFGDNAAFIAKHKLLAASPKQITKYAKFAQFWGFFFAAVLDVFALVAAVGKQESDPSAAKKEIKSAVLGLAKDGSDTLVTMAAVGYCKSVWHPNAYTAGVLTMVSGGVATYSNWKKVAKN